MDDKIPRRTFLAAATTGVWDALGCICRKIGRWWTICRKHWKDCTDDEFREHLKGTHGHERDAAKLKKMPREALMTLHNKHHEGGRYRGYDIDVVIPPPSKGRRLS